MHSYIGIDSLWVHVVHHGYQYEQDKCSKGLKKIHVGHIVYRKKATFFL